MMSLNRRSFLLASAAMLSAPAAMAQTLTLEGSLPP